MLETASKPTALDTPHPPAPTVAPRGEAFRRPPLDALDQLPPPLPHDLERTDDLLGYLCFPVLIPDTIIRYTASDLGPYTLVRLFPDSVYHLFRIDGHLTRGIAFHAFFMWLFAANGLAYLVFLAVSGQWRNILPDRRSFRELPGTLLTEVTSRHTPKPGQKYSSAQRFAYTAVILMGIVSVVTGAAIWKPTTLSFVTAMCGGYQSARLLHFWLTLAFCGFFLVHVLQVFRAGWNTLRAMITGAELQPIVTPEPATAPSPRPSPPSRPTPVRAPGHVHIPASVRSPINAYRRTVLRRRPLA